MVRFCGTLISYLTNHNSLYFGNWSGNKNKWSENNMVQKFDIHLFVFYPNHLQMYYLSFYFSDYIIKSNLEIIDALLVQYSTYECYPELSGAFVDLFKNLEYKCHINTENRVYYIFNY